MEKVLTGPLQLVRTQAPPRAPGTFNAYGFDDSHDVSVHFVNDGKVNGMRQYEVEVGAFLERQGYLRSAELDLIGHGYVVLDNKRRMAIQIEAEGPLSLQDPNLQEKLQMVRSSDLSGSYKRIGDGVLRVYY